MTHYLTFPDKTTWEAACEAAGWTSDGRYAQGPNSFASIVGQNYRIEDDVRIETDGWLGNVAGELPNNMLEYKLQQPPKHPKEVFA